MPGMDGAALLRTVHERWPRVVRIVLSGQTDQATMLRTVRVAHQCLAKPCDAGVLHDAVTRAFRLRDLLSDEALRTVVGGVDALPSPPALFAALEDALARPETGVAELAQIVERDGAVTAKLLQLAGSSFFGLPRRVTGVAQAVSYLGVAVVRALVLSHELTALAGGRLPVGFSLDAHQAHALATARLARHIARGTPHADDAFVAAILHDVGELLLATRAPDAFVRTRAHAAERGVPAHEAEAALLGGVTHAEVGAYLLGLWGLPGTVVDAVAFHHRPACAGARGVDAVTAVHIADALAHEGRAAGHARAAPNGTGVRTAVAPPALDLGYLATLGVDDASLAAWRAHAAELTVADGQAAGGAR
jgi:HD-like signal output (HDOD) protein